MAKLRSPNYPNYNLGAALALADKIFKADGRNKVSRLTVASHLNHESLSGPALGKIGALRAYGLLDGGGDDLRISDDAITALKAPEGSDEKKAAYARLALKPTLFQDIRSEYPTPPSVQNLSYWLIKNGFSETAAGIAARSYLETMELVNGLGGSYTPGDSDLSGNNSPKSEVKVGDHVQWTAAGVDQFQKPQRVVWISDDGSHLRVHGSMTGIPASEVTVVEAPSVIQTGNSPKGASNAYAGQDGELSVLLKGNRLEITADVDLAGVQRLKEILGKYEEILELL